MNSFVRKKKYSIAWNALAVIMIFTLIISNLSVVTVKAFSLSKEIAFIDSSVKDAGVLSEGIRSGAEIVYIDKGRDGIKQIADELSKQHDIYAIHIISHGASGEVHLGSGILSSESMGKYDPQLNIIKESMNKDGKILLYGCNIAEGKKGEKFIDELAKYIGTQISASANLTGNADKGGDWNLEYQTEKGNGTLPLLKSDTERDYKWVLGDSTLSVQGDSAQSGGLGPSYGPTLNRGGITVYFTDLTTNDPTVPAGFVSIEDPTDASLMSAPPGSWKGIFNASEMNGGWNYSDYASKYTQYLIIKKTGGGTFNFKEMKVSFAENVTLKIEGFNSGISTGSITHTNVNGISLAQVTLGSTQLTSSKFQNVDEVRVTGVSYDNGLSNGILDTGNILFNSFTIGDAVVPPAIFAVNTPTTANDNVNDNGKSNVTVNWTDSVTGTVNHYEIVAKVGSAPSVADTVTGQTAITPGTKSATFQWTSGSNLYVGVVAVDTNGLKTLCSGSPANVTVLADTASPAAFTVNTPTTANDNVNDNGKSNVTVNWTDSVTGTVNHYEIVAKVGSAPSVTDTVTGQTAITPGTKSATFQWTSGNNLYVGVVAVDTNGTKRLCTNGSTPNVTVLADTLTPPAAFTVNTPTTANDNVNDNGKSNVTVTWTDSATATVNHYEIVAKAGSAPSVTDTVTGQTAITPGTGTATFQWTSGNNLYVGVVAIDTNGLKTLCSGSPANVTVTADGHTPTATPVISGTPTAGDTTIIGTCVDSAAVMVTINSGTAAAATVTGTNWTITVPALVANDVISVVATKAPNTASTAATKTVVAPTAPTATTGVASSVTSTGAILGGTINDNGASTTVTFEYGTSTAYGSIATATPNTVNVGSGSTSVSAAISGLNPNTTYHFRVKGVNSAGTTNGNDGTFTTIAVAPTATTGVASSITSTGATLGGTINDNRLSTTVTFEYGLTTSYGSTATATPSTVNAGSGSTSVSAAISGLNPNTTYHFRVKGVNSAGTTNGNDGTFTTSAVVPTATTGVASSVTSTGAILGGTINDNGASTTVNFEYGTSTAYGSTATATPNTVNAGSGSTSISAAISGLNPNTTYHFRVKGVNSAGTTNGNDATFTTSIAAPTTISLTYTAGPNGTILGTAFQTVAMGTTGSAITAIPNAGYHFVSWSDGLTTATRTDSNITNNIDVTANFAATIPALVLDTTNPPAGTVGVAYSGFNFTSTGGTGVKSYAVTSGSLPAGLSLAADGALTGTPTTTSSAISFTVTVTDSAVPTVTDSHLFTMTINAPVTFSLTYTAGANGSITGTTSQAITLGDSGTAVTAVPNAGYHFVSWSDGVTTATRTDRNITNNINVTANFAADVISGGGGGGGTTTSSKPSTSVTGNVVDNTGQSIKGIPAQVITGIGGTKTISVKAAEAVSLKQPNGEINALGDTTKLSFSSVASTDSKGTVTFKPDGTIEVSNLANGTETKFDVTYDLGNGQKLVIGKIDVKVSSNGTASLTSSLIDPYGIITDSATGAPIEGVNVTLHYANTDRNIKAGKTPDTIVALPGIEGFKPNNNKNPQISDKAGDYGWMVFPTSDYYIVAEKDGYYKYISPTISVEQEIVKWDFRMNKKGSQINGVNRLFGQDRIDTALSIAKAAYPNKVQNIVLASSKDFPDALGGAPLAHKLNAPLVLVGSSDADKQKVLDFIKEKMDATGTVYILGGYGSVSKEFEGAVVSKGFKNVKRIGGADRYETSVKIAKELKVAANTPVIIANGESFADALSISSIAAMNGYPILLVQKDGMTDAVKAQLKTIAPGKVFIVGLQGAVGTSVEKQITDILGTNPNLITRIGGVDRYETSLAIAKYFKLDGSNICIASGSNFPDAVAGSIYSANLNSTIILVGSEPTQGQLQYLTGKKASGAAIFGGEGSVSKSIEGKILQILAR